MPHAWLKRMLGNLNSSTQLLPLFLSCPVMSWHWWFRDPPVPLVNMLLPQVIAAPRAEGSQLYVAGLRFYCGNPATCRR